jgi:hypothetical protein
VDWSKSLISLTGVEQDVVNSLIIPNSPSGYTLDPTTQVFNAASGVWETSLTVFQRDGVTPVSVTVGLTPKDSLGNTGVQVSSIAKTVLTTNAYNSDPAATLIGGSGNDILFTDHIGDILIGGGGADALYIASNIAAIVKLTQASDSSVSSYDTVTGFTSNDTLDISELVSSYTSVTKIPVDTGNNKLFFENVTFNTTTRVYTADVVYRGEPVLGEGDFQIEFALQGGRPVTIINTTSTGSWTFQSDVRTVGGYALNTVSVETGVDLNGDPIFKTEIDDTVAVLTDGQRLFTARFTLASGDTSYLFATNSVSLNGLDLSQIEPVFAGIPNSNELVVYYDGSSLGTVGDNSLHYSQDSNGIRIKYDTNPTAGSISQSAEIYIAGITNLTAPQLITVI